MFTVLKHMILLMLPVTAPAQSPAFSFAGITLDSELNQVARRYVHSSRTGEYIYVAPEDSHDHISAIEISGAGALRRVRISFEFRRRGQPPDFPHCAKVQTKLDQRFGPPSSIRRFTEEASRRMDRAWRSPTQELTLICFGGPGGRWFAEAVQINRLK